MGRERTVLSLPELPREENGDLAVEGELPRLPGGQCGKEGEGWISTSGGEVMNPYLKEWGKIETEGAPSS